MYYKCYWNNYHLSNKPRIIHNVLPNQLFLLHPWYEERDYLRWSHRCYPPHNPRRTQHHFTDKLPFIIVLDHHCRWYTPYHWSYRRHCWPFVGLDGFRNDQHCYSLHWLDCSANLGLLDCFFCHCGMYWRKCNVWKRYWLPYYVCSRSLFNRHFCLECNTHLWVAYLLHLSLGCREISSREFDNQRNNWFAHSSARRYILLWLSKYVIQIHFSI